MQLPQDFIAEMQGQMDEQELQQFMAAMDEPCPTSIRINTRKIKADDLDMEVAGGVEWCDDGVYLKERPSFTMDPLFHAGTYYVQEASSMFISHLLNQYLPDGDINALDLCAAPGGKSTLLASHISEGSTLIANEIMPKRAHILQENITKWGAENVIVTNNRSEDFEKMDETFDLILCDVPCSGEGMFRKDATAIGEWSVENVEMCWKRQREIVENIWGCLKPGGLMIYSTCTYNTKENEENVKWISEELGAEVLPCNARPEWNITGNLLGETFDCCHFMPHKTQGEGFFCAILKKEGERKEGKKAINDKMMKKMRVLTTKSEGSTEDIKGRAELDKQTALKYLHGEAIVLGQDIPRGIIQVTYRGQVLGLAKNIGNRANNLYPKEWRIRKQI